MSYPTSEFVSPSISDATASAPCSPPVKSILPVDVILAKAPPDHVQAKLPVYSSEHAAGADLCAHIASPEILEPGQRKAIATGLRIALPQGYEGQVRSRSGLALNHGVVVLSSPGTIDSDYRGEVKVVLFNASQDVFVIEPGMRIAQLIVAPVIQVHWQSVTELTPTQRAEGGFGSTGL